RQDNFINDGIKPRLLQLGPMTLAPSTEAGKSSGLTFHYSPYAVGPYVEGPYTVFVPWTAFKHFLSMEGLALFGGERPKADADNW
ncbi:MAG: RsiV family protein, partial [Xanthobacteraceae bacterium]